MENKGNKGNKGKRNQGKSVASTSSVKTTSSVKSMSLQSMYSRQRLKICAGYAVGSLLFIGLGFALHSPAKLQSRTQASQAGTIGSPMNSYKNATASRPANGPASAGTHTSEHSQIGKKEKCIKINGYPEATKWHAHDGCEESE